MRALYICIYTEIHTAWSYHLTLSQYPQHINNKIAIKDVVDVNWSLDIKCVDGRCKSFIRVPFETTSRSICLKLSVCCLFSFFFLHFSSTSSSPSSSLTSHSYSPSSFSSSISFFHSHLSFLLSILLASLRLLLLLLFSSSSPLPLPPRLFSPLPPPFPFSPPTPFFYSFFSSFTIFSSSSSSFTFSSTSSSSSSSSSFPTFQPGQNARWKPPGASPRQRASVEMWQGNEWHQRMWSNALN